MYLKASAIAFLVAITFVCNVSFAWSALEGFGVTIFLLVEIVSLSWSFIDFSINLVCL